MGEVQIATKFTTRLHSLKIIVQVCPGNTWTEGKPRDQLVRTIGLEQSGRSAPWSSNRDNSRSIAPALSIPNLPYRREPLRSTRHAAADHQGQGKGEVCMRVGLGAQGG